MDTETARDSLTHLAAGHPGLRLLVLYGSRAGEQAREGADWDLAYLADGDLDPLELLAEATTALGSDDVDLVDLATASGLLRFRVARDGVALYEDPPGAFEEFVLQAVHFWCDAGPVIRAAHEAVLADLH